MFSNSIHSNFVPIVNVCNKYHLSYMLITNCTITIKLFIKEHCRLTLSQIEIFRQIFIHSIFYNTWIFHVIYLHISIIPLMCDQIRCRSGSNCKVGHCP